MVDEDFRRSMYESLRESFPELFVNPPGAAYEILTDPDDVAEAEASYTAELLAAGLPEFMGESGVVYADPFVMAVRDAIRLPDNDFGMYMRVVPAGNASGVVVLPRYGDDIVLIRHFRHSTRDWKLEIPRGYGMPDTDPADDARRELREEIGVEATTLHDLGTVFPDTGVSGTAVRLFYAEISEPPTPSDPIEGIEAVQTVSPAELAKMIGDDTITDGFTISAYTRAVLRGYLPLVVDEA